MRTRVTVDTGSRPEAEAVAALLPDDAKAHSSRGYGFVRLAPRTKAEIAEVVAIVAAAVERSVVAWARVRWDDEERYFRAPRQRAASSTPASAASPAAEMPAIR